MIDSARRTVTELGLRHALLEVEQFAGIVEMIVDDPTAAEPHFRQAYNGFRRMGLDADTAETAALLGCTCLALDRDAEADELCLESERLAGHALKASIAWRTLRARLLSRGHEHGEARRIAEAAVALAERTDALVDHGDSCLTLATVLGAAGDAAGARTAAERAVDLYERKGAAALAERARRILGERELPSGPMPPEPPPVVELDNACIRAGKRLAAAINRGALDEYEQLHAPNVFSESRRKAVGFTQAAVAIVPPENWAHEVRRVLGASGVRLTAHDIAVRGERLALTRVVVGTADASPGAPQDEFLEIYGIDEEGRISLQIFFDLEDMDAAIAELDAVQARFEQEAHRQARRLENAASHASARHSAHFAARDWDELANVLAEDILVDDRRRVVNAGIKRGRDAEIANLRAVADVGITYTAFVVIAARGERLILTRASVGGVGSAEFSTDALSVVEINADDQIAAIVIFEPDDFDSAIAELDARYLAGEAAAHAGTWSVIAGAYAALNRHEFPATTPDWVNIDHRGETAFGSADLKAYLRAGLEEPDQDINVYIEAVHRLTDPGAVLTYAAHETSRDGFDAEWRGVALMTVDGEMVSRSEVFDEADLHTALAKFDQLSRPGPRLENAASQVSERYMAHFAASDWDELAKVLADDICVDDRRRVVNAGIKHGRDAEIANLRAAADVGITYFASVVIAARGQRLILARVSGGEGGGSGEFLNEVLGVVEINSHNQIAAIVLFELDDFDSAIAELDARYVAGEAAAHANVLLPVMDAVGELNRHKPGPMLRRTAFADHRRVPFGSAEDYGRAIEELWTLVPDARYWTKTVHALDAHGIVSTLVIEGTDAHGNELQWGRTFLFLSDGRQVEVYEEDGLDAAIARFEELRPQARRLENAASQAAERYSAHFAARDWDALAKILADDIVTDDRRRVANAGIRHGRDADIANLQATADAGFTYMAPVVIAARGEHLMLARTRVSGGDGGSGEVIADTLGVVEINSHNQVAAIVVFELDDFESALAELDARYLAGEAAAHAGTWSVIAGVLVAHNRREIAAVTTDVVSLDHRRGAAFAPGEGFEYIRAGWDLGQNLNIYPEIAHRLNDLGAVFTWAGHGTSHEGFEAEWRGVTLMTVDGEMVSRMEVFDEGDLDAGLARFDQLSRPTPRLENSATSAWERLFSYIAAGDWDAVTRATADNVSVDDRRRVVNAGILHGRDANIKDAQATVDVGFAMTMEGVLATRGERLALIRVRVSGRDAGAIQNDALNIAEIDADDRIVAGVVFDLDDVDAAFAELDARYIAGEGAAHAGTWSLIAGAFVAHNRRELPATTPDPVSIDHRRVASFAPGEGFEYIRAGWELDQNLNLYIETAHRVNDRGAVFTWTGSGTSHEGFEAEWRGVNLMTVDGEMLDRSEVFDEEDLDAALAKFEELSRPAPRLVNTASQVTERFLACFAAREWDAMPQILGDVFSYDDRRRVVGSGVRHGGDAHLADMRASADLWTADVTPAVVATRGERLVLAHLRFPGRDQGAEAFVTDVLGIVEINVDERMVAFVSFELDDFDAAFAELDARYIAGEAAPFRDAWSVIAAGYAALNRYEVPPSAPDYVNIDHRLRATFEAADLGENLRAAWDLTPELKGYIEVVHRLSGLGAVVTHAAHGTTQDGLDAEWRGIHFLTLEGGMVDRCEIFFEADLDAAITRFNQLSLPALRLKTSVAERISTHITARDWDALAQDFAENYCLDDRRRVVNAGVMHGQDAGVETTRVAAELGLLTNTTSTIIASRGERLTLERFHASGADHESVQNDALNIVEIDADERIAAVIMFDVDDIDAAFAELDARYLAGEAAPHAHTWSVIARIYAGFNRHEPPATTPDSVFTDHRPLQNLGAVDLVAAIRSMWDVASDLNVSIEAVHRLSELGAVVTQTLKGTSQEGLDAEWRTIEIFTVEGELLSRCEAFDEADLDAALARFEELQPQTQRLQNAASRVTERCRAVLAVRDWDAMAEILAEGFSSEDRRRVVNSGIRQGRDLGVKDMQAAVDVIGITYRTSVVIATRGERLELISARVSNYKRPETVQFEVLQVSEIDTDGRVAAVVTMDIDDIDAAFEELDTRYLAGDAAAHAHTWSVIAQAYAAVNRHELPATTQGWVNIDHRRGRAFVPGDLEAYLRATWDVLTPDVRVYIEKVHRLSKLGAVVTRVAKGTSREGFDAEWREIGISTVEGDLISRSELFDEADLDAALARFEELQPQAPRLENAASRMDERLRTYLGAREWAAMANLLTEDTCTDDRRRIVNVGIRRGRDVTIAYGQAMADLGVKIVTSDVVAIRGERLFLSRARWLGPDQRLEDFHTDVLNVVEIDSDERIVARVMFDADDIDAAFTELDARYLAGEAAAHARTWSVIARECAAFNRHELTAVDYITVDHRPLPIIEAYSQAALRVWDVTPDFGIHSEAVHRLSGFGAVATYQANGASPEGFDGEWRLILLLTVEGDRIDRCEVFDESDLDAALARFEELHTQTPRLQNAASQQIECFRAYFAARNWAAVAENSAHEIFTDDRRSVVGSGILHGRDIDVANIRAIADLGATDLTSTVIATRGERLVLTRLHLSGRDQRPEAFHSEMLGIVEIDEDNRVAARFLFDLNDIDAAFEELDARYLAGEAAAHARTWSAIAGVYAAFNRRELPAPDYVTVDHRRATLFTSSELAASIRDSLDLTPDLSIHIEAVHRLNNFGALLTNTSYGTSQEGFDAEWRMIQLLTVEGDRVNRLELFDETDLDAALARFEELQPQAGGLENAASQVAERFWMYFAKHEWAAMAETIADDCCTHDRRRVVNADVLRGRAAHVTNMRAVAEVGFDGLTSAVLATREHRLALIRIHSSARGSAPGEVTAEMLSVVEIDTDNRLTGAVIFDSDDIDTAFEELESRYIAGEASDYAHTWSVIARTLAAFNRHELPAADWVIIDHRRLAPVDASDLPAAIRAIWDLTPDLSTRIEAVHRLSSFGAVVTNTAYGTSPEGFAAEWRVVDLVTVEGDRISRDEFFDEADVDAALARFEELHPQAPRLENAAGRTLERYQACFSTRDWAAMAELLVGDFVADDRRRVVNAGVQRGREVHIADLRAAVEVGAETISSSVVATRGERLALAHARAFNRGAPPGEVGAEWLGVAEIDADERIAAFVVFDVDDIDVAFDELEARYLAGEAAAYARTWSVNSRLCAGFNRGELPATTPDWIYIDHRPLVTIEANDALASMRVGRDLTPDIRVYVEAVHRLSDLGAVVTAPVYGSSHEGFAAEWRMIDLFTVEGDLINRLEIFDEADLDSALARFDELDRRTPSFGNAATRTWARAAEAFNGRDVDSFLALMTADGQFEDRRKGLRAVHKGAARRKAARAVFEEAPASWRMHPAPIAIRGSRFELTRESYCDTDDADRPIAVELLHVMELDDADLMRDIVSFDPDDLDDAVAELTARWIASGEVAYPEVIEAVDRINATINRHDWDAVATHFAGAEYVNHRQLGHPADGTIADWLSTTGSLVPNFWVELAEILARSAIGIVGRMALKGTSTDGAAIEIAFVGLILLHGERVTRLEAFEEDQRDLALDRLQDFNRPV